MYVWCWNETSNETWVSSKLDQCLLPSKILVTPCIHVCTIITI